MQDRPATDPDRPSGAWISRERIRRILLAAFVLVLPFALFHFVAPFVGTQTIGNDYTRFPLPAQMELQYSIAHGTWPAYSPGFAGGRSAAALTLGQLWHPISHLAAHLPGYWDGHAIDWNTLLRLLSLGLAHLALIGVLRRLGLRRDAAFLVAFVTVYNMRMLDAFRFGASLESYTGMLLVCAAAAHLFLSERRLLPAAALIGSTYLLAVGGHPQMMYFGFLGAVIFIVAAPFALPAVAQEPLPDRRRTLRFYGRAAACLVAGCALAAAYLAPLYTEFVAEAAVRAARAACLVAGCALAAAYLAPLYTEFVAEAAVRAARAYSWSLLNTDSVGGALNSFFRPLDVSVTGGFGGSSLIVVALLTPFLAKAAGRTGIVALALLGAVALAFVVSLGAVTPLHRLAWEWLPFFDAFRVPGRIRFVLPVVLMLLLAWAFGRRGDARAELWGRPLPISWSGALALVSLAAFAAYWLWLGDLLPPPRSPLPAKIGHVPAAVPHLLAALGAGTLALAAVRGLNPRASGALGVALVLAVVAETGVVLRFGTWIAPRRDTPTMARMDQEKQRSLAFRGDPGYGMQSDLVAEKMKRSFFDRNLAVFYDRYVAAGGKKAAFDIMARSRSADEAVIEGFRGGGARAASGGAASGGAATATIGLTRSTFNDVVFAVENAAPGFLSYTALDRKGRWSAEVDGRAARVFAANGGEQAVRLEPGRHEVAFKFDSPATRVGVAVSLATLALVAVFASLLRRRSVPRVLCAIGAVGSAAAVFFVWNGALHDGDDLHTRYTWSSTKTPDPTNLAFGRPTEMSSIRQPQRPYECYAGLGVNGDTHAPGFSTKHQGSRPWWQVDLGSRRAIGRLEVYRGSAVPKRGPLPFEVALSDDGKSFRTIPTDAAIAEGVAWRIAVGGDEARYVRLTAVKPGVLALAEVEVFAPGGEVGIADAERAQAP
jgi:hypothetical protein